MHPYLFQVFGLDIPSFTVMLLVGAGVGFAVTAILCKPSGRIRAVNFDDTMYAAGACTIGAVIGAACLRPLMRLPEVIAHWDVYRVYPAVELLRMMFSEIVFFGGLIGGALAIIIYCRVSKLPLVPTLDAFAAAVPAGHAIGRIGCLLGGCCYGMEVAPGHPFAVVYPPASLAAPSGVPLLAAPAIESASLLVIAVLVAVAYLKTRAKGLCVGLYLTLYATERFILEFYRGDAVRGLYGGLSTSQYIAIIAFAAGVILLIYAWRSRRAEKEDGKVDSAFNDDMGKS